MKQFKLFATTSLVAVCLTSFTSLNASSVDRDMEFEESLAKAAHHHTLKPPKHANPKRHSFYS